MSRFYGSEICMLDTKGRINVPARMRRNLAPEANDTFIIVRSFDPCVNLYPADEFEHFDAKLMVLRDQVVHHAHEEEEGQLFPLVRKLFDEDDLAALGNEMMASFEKLLEKGEPRMSVPSETRAAAQL